MADQQQVVFTANAPTPLGPYSQAIKTPTAIYCSGQIPLTSDGVMIEGSIAEKTTQCCKNLEAVLTEAGSSLRKIVKLNVFLSDMAHFAEMNSTYERFFPHKPARSCVAVKTLPRNVDVEIEAIALP
ncbi:protein HMF1 [Ophiocordyceps camponoti-floridani]|uniref:Protein HMF1 n=1 Tax=Ophiocordyceps camponoti-floridani TaxID=2030778 RepID=A0A8H4Q0X1_9HYPO|nr:protein HMF1 [Ophiocordyceps camponoti-floridani]